MKLGRALATGVAEERPEVHEEVVDRQDAGVVEEPAVSAPEEVPVAR
ncbi:hypothetical protein ACFOZ0_23325 [Streptomyces yaanensis]|uniref:Uncharacterized protein n=1 Tax=Streptomyces yaanensis TaxID=1142239 RepID=A0ABV7SKD7_9ACTN|nr:hypothetical protein [Streptomyces sp. CGMCC 4.7035]WNC01149.1 hypothetical protein Q2K21_25540 [Streptomyces sp. CGMCC 4.7035]